MDGGIPHSRALGKCGRTRVSGEMLSCQCGGGGGPRSDMKGSPTLWSSGRGLRGGL